MSIYPVSVPADTSTTNSSSITGSSSTDTTTMFMQLLATELQSQDPTQTMDPTTMVTQMVQINQLSDVSGIYSILQNGTTSGSTTGGSSDAIRSTSQNALGGN
jgi:flagellar hook assembly protein FlgD